MKTPKKLASLIAIAAGSLLLVPIASIFWYHRVGSSLFLATDTDADSFGVIVGGLSIVTLIVVIVVSVFMAITMRPYPGRVPLFSRASGNTRTSLLSVLAIMLTVLSAGILLLLVLERSVELVPSALGLLYVSLSVWAASSRFDNPDAHIS